ncbi:MAG: hypothetical protein EON57_19865, partial [Alphaproteobacteria bacterium]
MRAIQGQLSFYFYSHRSDQGRGKPGMHTICAALAALAFACGPENATGSFIDIGNLLPPKPADSANSMAASAADLDGDGDLDLVIAVEYGRNRVLINDGTGRFAEGRLGGPSGDHEDVAIAAG